MATMFVARGHSLSIDGQIHAPGAMVVLASDEAEFLAKRGFLQDTPPTLPVAEEVPNPASIGLQRAGEVQGPVYR